PPRRSSDLPAHLESTWCPWVDASEIVDNDRDPLVDQEIPVLLRLREAMTADVDGVAVLRDAEADRDDMRRAMHIGGSEAGEPLALQILELFTIECRHSGPPKSTRAPRSLLLPFSRARIGDGSSLAAV